ncbi:MAG: PHP domain-containing protein [Lachnospiraceae bacterium]|nr:PHP domain-containing protein [Lachnospiraceae bacterium]
MEKLIDLHVHSNCSDGTLSPEELVAYALEKNLSAMALTDHDTVDGISRAQTAAENTGLELIPGIELSTEHWKKDIHILGLGINIYNQIFLEELKHFQNSRNIRNDKMIARLQEYQIAITADDMLAAFPNCVWTRAHFARFLLEHGYVGSLTEAFDRYLGDHAPCFVPREKVTPLQAIELIHNAGGYAILAHPLLYHLSDSNLEILVDELCQHGLDGIEAIYSTYRFSDESRMKQLAGRHGLSITGGSDFHGANKPAIDLGTGKGDLKISYEFWDILKATPPAQQE